MKIQCSSAFFLWALLAGPSSAQDAGRFTLPPSCQELNRSALAAAEAGHPEAAESRLSAALADGARGPGAACVGLVLINMASFAQVSGRFAEAEGLAQRAIHTLEATVGPKAPVLLSPLQTLASASLEQGKVGQARKAFQRMQLIPADRPDAQAIVHGLAAIQLEMQQEYGAAETEYREALSALEQAGRGTTADAASTLLSLGNLLIRKGSLPEAAEMLDRSQSVFQTAPDTAPLDWIKLLNLRAALHARQGHWQQAENELRDAMALADQQQGLDQSFRFFLLTNYAKALRKNHHREEAGLVEARIASLKHPAAASALVDITEFSVMSKPSKK